MVQVSLQLGECVLGGMAAREEWKLKVAACNMLDAGCYIIDKKRANQLILPHSFGINVIFGNKLLNMNRLHKKQFSEAGWPDIGLCN